MIRARDIPSTVACVLSGHIHRAQALTTDLDGRKLPAPVLYPGSVERTSFAEKDERKGYLIVAIETASEPRERLRGWRFHELPARPMVAIEVDEAVPASAIEDWLRARLTALHPESVVSIRMEDPKRLGAAVLRRLAPPTMNVSLAFRARSRSGSTYGRR